jgi:hypothetical protein
MCNHVVHESCSHGVWLVISAKTIGSKVCFSASQRGLRSKIEFYKIDAVTTRSELHIRFGKDPFVFPECLPS